MHLDIMDNLTPLLESEAVRNCCLVLRQESAKSGHGMQISSAGSLLPLA